MKIYIYALCEPETGVPKYIGRSKNPNNRLTSHINEIKKHSNDKTKWLKELMLKFQIPEILILEETNLKECAFWEEHYVNLYKSWGIELFNKDNSFNKNYCHEKSALKISDNQKIRYSQESIETKNKRIESIKRLNLEQPHRVIKRVKRITEVQGIRIECTHIDNTVLIFDSIGEAARSLNLNRNKIQDKVKGRRYGKYKGWTFRYIIKEDN